MKERPKHSIVRRFWKIGHYGAICFALLFGLTFASGVRQAHAAEVTVTDMISLFDQMNNNEDGSTIVLGADIDNGLDGWPISVFPEESVTIDLAGHKLTLQTTAESMAPALAISAGASLTVIDSSPDKTGELIADSSAVPGAAGIGWCRDCYWEGAGTITIAGGTVKATGVGWRNHTHRFVIEFVTYYAT
ncbi:hypothetical protein K0U00_35615 [Paenibacillus sepulcri]|uniref:WxL domain-containing protein n=1 Tax=Paenibacillus sepulcri TaxID=359917 RepID=A0ABS7CEP5_9BACL|nr:hypothetical protein [Paenibacillus sepulcri]